MRLVKDINTLDPNKFRFRFRKIVGIIKLFVRKLKARIVKNHSVNLCQSKLPTQFAFNNGIYLVIQGQ